MVSMRQFKYFVEIVDAGGYTRAAERLCIAQSALSRQIKDLEALLEVQLLRRGAGPLELTPAGRRFEQGARQLLDLAAVTIGESRQVARGEQGLIRLVHSSSVPLGGVLMARIDAYLRDHPGVSLDISQLTSEHQGADIAEGRADVGLLRLPVHRKFPGVSVTHLFSEPLMLAAPAGHRLAQREAVSVTELREEAFVSTAFWQRGGLSYRVADLCQQHGFVPKAARATSRKTTLLSLVGAGFGIAIVPAGMAAICPAGVRLVALAGGDSVSSVAMVHREQPGLPAAGLVAALLA
jgi:DNA-binding transcriptional LysR family regulator